MSPLPPEYSDEREADWFYRARQPSSAPEHVGDAPTAPLRLTCWRCDKSVLPRLGRCPYCRARLETLPEERIVLPEAKRVNPIVKVLWLLGGLMVVSLVTHWVVQSEQARRLREADWQNLHWKAIVIAEAISTGLVLLGLLWIGRLPALSRPEGGWRLAAWLWALPALALLLGLNVAYHWLMLRYLQVPMIRPELPLNAAALLLLCLQPALVEELFFRYLALGSLREHMGVHGAVWVSSVMFGMAHIGVLVSIPILVILGVGLGYARVLSGGLVLPMLMHFLHNAVVLYLSNLL